MEHYAQRLAALTPGFAGAEIANICNEAAIIAARREADCINMDDFEGAVDRVIGGIAKKNMVMSQEEKRTVAYHEAGHAIAGWLLEHADPLLKVTIVPHSNGALGYAQYLPKELALHTGEQLRDKICMALGGRAAEELHFDKITNGAADDLRRVTQMAKQMVTVFGMNERVGHVSWQPTGEFERQPYSEATAVVIDEEVKQLIDDMYVRTKELLIEHKDKVEALAEELLRKESINVDDVVRLIGTRPFSMPMTYGDFVSEAWQRPEEADAAAVEDEEETEEDNGPSPAMAARPTRPML